MRGTAAHPVYRHYSQAELDAQYDNQRHVPDFRALIESYGVLSERARQKFPNQRDIAYGSSERERVDIILPHGDVQSAPINIFVHGGAWRVLSKNENAYPAFTFCAAGAILIAAGFDLATRVPLERMVTQVRTIVGWTFRHAQDFGGDRNRIFLTAHSSGAHLSAMAAAQWDDDLPDDPVKGAVLISGVYDLEPVRLTYRNEMLRLDAETARRLSPIEQSPRSGLPVTIACAGGDTDEFRRQSRAFAERWTRRGAACKFHEFEGRNHYDLISDLADPSSRLSGLCLHQMGLAPTAGTA